MPKLLSFSFCSLLTSWSGQDAQGAAGHGLDLHGMGPTQGLADRLPSYLVRQAYDLEQRGEKASERIGYR
ncbi:MAG: hypothetical protein KGM92_22530 [Acidobacteriota bacterium]|nr:hypothetical protein [Acidobacteriota bacterium]